jgi:glycosyltransferase involved in cell wall biosynthesis
MSQASGVPAASVIMPVYNAGRFLDKAIESVLGQSFPDFELLLLNDGSSDGSLDRLHHYATRDARCKVHSWANRGLIQTLNEGIRLAKADILIRMDGDDICRTQRFERQIAYLAAHPECVAVGSRVMLIDPDGQAIRPFAEQVEHAAIDAQHLTGYGGAIAHPAVALRKAAVIGVGGYRAEFPHAEDIDLFLRLAEHGRLSNLPEVLLDYRQHLDSIGYRHPEKQRESTLRAVSDARKRRGLEVATQFSTDLTPVRRNKRADIHRMWSWWALAEGNHSTALKHVWQAFKHEPFNTQNLKLGACIIRGH